MKLKDLFESQQLADVLEQCTAYLNTPGAKKEFLYRGIDLPDHLYITEQINIPRTEETIPLRWTVIKTSRTRAPVATPRSYSDAADFVFNQKFNWKPRTTGVFATGSQAEASGYGELHIFLPIGPFRFIWSPEVEDLYLTLRSLGGNALHPNKFGDAVNDTTYYETDLDDAILSKCEITFDCESYLLINVQAKYHAGFIRNELRRLTGIDK